MVLPLPAGPIRTERRASASSVSAAVCSVRARSTTDSSGASGSSCRLGGGAVPQEALANRPRWSGVLPLARRSIALRIVALPPPLSRFSWSVGSHRRPWCMLGRSACSKLSLATFIRSASTWQRRVEGEARECRERPDPAGSSVLPLAGCIFENFDRERAHSAGVGASYRKTVGDGGAGACRG